MKITSFEINGKLKDYTDSLLFDSGTEVASATFEDNGLEINIILKICGDVRVLYKDIVYKSPSEFPEELKELIKKGEPNDDLYIDSNNWFEFICGETEGVYCEWEDGVICEDDVSAFSETMLKAKMLEVAKWFLSGC